jgi:hypothetical protein
MNYGKPCGKLDRRVCWTIGDGRVYENCVFHMAQWTIWSTITFMELAFLYGLVNHMVYLVTIIFMDLAFLYGSVNHMVYHSFYGTCLSAWLCIPYGSVDHMVYHNFYGSCLSIWLSIPYGLP